VNVAFDGGEENFGSRDADVPIPFAPDLAVKVISVLESAWAVEKKVREYLHAGVSKF